MHALWVCLGLVLGQAETPAAAPPDAQAELSSQVRKLVRELDSAELAKRDAAEKQLLELGPAVLDVLPPVTNRTSAEVKERLARVRDRLQRAEAESVVQPKRVTLDTTGLNFAEVLKALTEQTGNKIIDYREQLGQEVFNPAIELKFENTPFWEAFDKTVDAAGADLYPYVEEENVLAVSSRPDADLPLANRSLAYAGPFRIEPTQIDASLSLRNPQSRSLQLELQLAWEPRLRPIVLEQPLDQITAVDESDNPIEVEGSEGSVDILVTAGSSASSMTIPLIAPTRKTQRIARLQGKLTALVPGRVETFTFEDFKATNQTQKQPGVAVTLERVRRNADVWEFRILVRFENPGEALQSHLGWIYDNEAYLVGADDQKVEPASNTPTRETEEEVGVAYLFDGDLKLSDYKLVYRTPTVILPLELPYELKDLELP